jgi:hypothetical protein
VAVSGDRLFVADGFAGMMEIDISDPSHPVVAGAYDTPGSATSVSLSGGLAWIADGNGGLRVVRPNPSIPPPSLVTNDTIDVTLPAGINPGAYDVQVSGPAGLTQNLPNAYIVCHDPVFTARLVPSRWPVPSTASPSIRWRLEVEGEAALFQPQPQHQARLLLPELPSVLSIQYASGRDAIEIWPSSTRGAAEVRLIGADRAALLSLWQSIAGQGGVDLARRDNHDYGDLSLSLVPAGRPGGAGASMNGLPRVRYEFEDDRLTAARAYGAGADFVFEVTASAGGCETTLQVDFAQTVYAASAK